MITGALLPPDQDDSFFGDDLNLHASIIFKTTHEIAKDGGSFHVSHSVVKFEFRFRRNNLKPPKIAYQEMVQQGRLDFGDTVVSARVIDSHIRSRIHDPCDRANITKTQRGSFETARFTRLNFFVHQVRRVQDDFDLKANMKRFNFDAMYQAPLQLNTFKPRENVTHRDATLVVNYWDES